ncbi:MAG: serine protein kinase, partial [Candidatus Eisenbacteria bacterium]|nr:serine protein kinase [Candidatus Eisenbacteria bacterium]
MSSFDPYEFIRSRQSPEEFKELNWLGTFDDYVRIVTANPKVTRNAFQRMYDMILSHGIEEYVEFKKKIYRYRFFDDPIENGADGIFGLEVPLMKLVNFFRAAAFGYGPEKRVLLLHGPVGSCKSTIARLLKKGIEQYSRTPHGALYSFSWKMDLHHDHLDHCPMNQEPLLLIPRAIRDEFIEELNPRHGTDFQVRVEGDLDPYCQRHYDELMLRYNGDWSQVMQHVVVRRLLLSE